MTFELEQRRALGRDGSYSGSAAVTAFGMTAEFFPDADAFARSERSLLDPATADDPAPDQYVENGLMWPPKMAPESFISWGAFPGGDDAVADARLNGVVLSAERRRNVATGRRFLAARVACLGFEVDLVTEWEHEDVPAPGSIVATDTFLVASIDTLTFSGPTSAPRRRWSLFGR
ncbi:hypothetical protein [Leifsonia sp. EB34]|uniref:hypothetical protein n=1 Tax=Leifsonia sp. EB34 TaxID=3156303 RepID=UPI003517CEBD